MIENTAEARIQELIKDSLLYEDEKIVSTKSISERIQILQNSLTKITSELQLLNKSEYKSLLKQGQILFLVEDRILLLDKFLFEIKSVTKQINAGDLQLNYKHLQEEQTKLTKLYNILNYLDSLN